MTRPWKNDIDLDHLRASLVTNAARGLESAAALVLKTSDAEVPYLSRDLLKSGRSGMVNDTTAAVTYLNPKAVAVHEDLVAKRRHGRSAKFLENAFNSSRARVLEIIAKEARRGLD